MFISGVSDTDDKKDNFEINFFSHFVNSFVGSTEQFFGGVVDIGDIFYVFLLFLTGINDTGEKCYHRWQRHCR
jgi:hypothetical protein